jgi:hypothetical protein
MILNAYTLDPAIVTDVERRPGFSVYETYIVAMQQRPSNLYAVKPMLRRSMNGDRP